MHKLYEKSGVALALLARSERFKGNVAGAGHCFQEAVQQEADNHFIWHEWFEWAYFDASDLELAEVCLLKAVDLDSSCKKLCATGRCCL